jgi:hypothetical protein
MDKMDQIIDSHNQSMNSHEKSIAKIEAPEEEPSPIYWPPQQYTKRNNIPFNSSPR